MGRPLEDLRDDTRRTVRSAVVLPGQRPSLVVLPARAASPGIFVDPIIDERPRLRVDLRSGTQEQLRTVSQGARGHQLEYRRSLPCLAPSSLRRRRLRALRRNCKLFHVRYGKELGNGDDTPSAPIRYACNRCMVMSKPISVSHTTLALVGVVNEPATRTIRGCRSCRSVAARRAEPAYRSGRECGDRGATAARLIALTSAWTAGVWTHAACAAPITGRKLSEPPAPCQQHYGRISRVHRPLRSTRPVR